MPPNEAPAPSVVPTPAEPLEGELARFFGYSHDLLVVMDAEGDVVVISPSVERTLGYGMEEVVGRSFLSFVHVDDVPVARSRAQKLVEGNVVPDLDLRLRRADGTWAPMRCSISAGPHGRIYGVARDRTADLRQREHRFQREMAEFRLRTALELHDGILQTLTGASFQIAAARRLVGQDPAAAEEVLAALARGVSAEQQELRLYVDEIKGQDALVDGALPDLEDRIRGMLDRVTVIWGVEAKAEVHVPEGLGVERERQLVRLVQEAVVNAARHGGAMSVEVTVEATGSDIGIRVSDDGHGFSFLGDFDHEVLKERRLGPLSLKRRVDSVGGRISILSTHQGSTLTLRVPVEGMTE